MYVLFRRIPDLLGTRCIQRLLSNQYCRKRTSQDAFCLSFRHVSVHTYAVRIYYRPTTLEHALAVILTRYKWKACLLYMDDIMIFSNDVEEYIHNVNAILTTLGEAGDKLKLKTCRLFSYSVDLFGHILKHRRLENNQPHTRSLMADNPTTNRSALRSFRAL